MVYARLDLAYYLLFYSLLGWLVEAVVCSVYRKKFVNRGFLNLPLRLSYGVIFCVLLVVLPTVKEGWLGQYVLTIHLVAMLDFLLGRISRWMSASNTRRYEEISLFSANWKGALAAVGIGTAYYLIYLLIHPFSIAFTSVASKTLLSWICIVSYIMIAVDFFTTLVSVRQVRGWSRVKAIQKREEEEEEKRFRKISAKIWGRLERAYPGLSETEPVTDQVFAKGVCFDKLIWVFLISALLGDFIETIYCRVVGGVWMSRSSVLYGPFSLVWGIGAVLLTLVLQRLAGKPDRYVFVASCFIGGVFEYTCSVFTEVVLGTTFWDYSNMPLNFGGRTNLLYCFFWGILAVFWIKICYPRMSKLVEKIPPITGQVVTWAIVLLMSCNALISAAAMVRYTERVDGLAPDNVIEELLDEAYDNETIERVWPNMRITAQGGTETIGIVQITDEK